MSLGSYETVLQHLKVLCPDTSYTIKDLTVLNLLKTLHCTLYYKIFLLLCMTPEEFCIKHRLKVETLKRVLKYSKAIKYTNKIKSITNYTAYKKAIIIEFILNKPKISLVKKELKLQPIFILKPDHLSSLFIPVKNKYNVHFVVHSMNDYRHYGNDIWLL
jgi:hypothetical protein